MPKDLKIGQKANLLFEWHVKPVDYSEEQKKNIIKMASEKYGIPESQIKVVPCYITANADGTTEALTNTVVENIQSPEYQHQLFKKYLQDNNIEYTDEDFNEILKIDGQINALINYDSYEKYRKYEIKWIRWSNFLSYGENNYCDFTTFKGLVLLTGNPANQSGKSTFAYDLLHFMLFGKTASGKADVLADIFNSYRPEATEVKVEGCIAIDGIDYIIRRTLTRPALSKRTAKSKVTQKVEYVKILGGEEIELADVDNMEGSTNTETTKIIKEAVGDENDFDLAICANADNLKSLISLKDTERGRLLSKWVGLLPLEDKDTIARGKWNSEISPKLLSNVYNRETLKAEIEVAKNNNTEYEKQKADSQKEVNEHQKKIDEYNSQKENLMGARINVDTSLLTVDVKTVENNLQATITKGVQTKEKKELAEKQLAEIGEVEFSENEYSDKVSEKEELIRLNARKDSEIENLIRTNKTLETSEYCPVCKRKYDNVDNSTAIAENKAKIQNLTEEKSLIEKNISAVITTLEAMESKRRLSNEKNRLAILIQKYESDMGYLRNMVVSYRKTLKDLETNKAVIEANNKIDASINIIKANIQVETNLMNAAQKDVINLDYSINKNNDSIKERENIIARIDEETKMVRRWKIYLTLVGKNGISKMVLRETLPLINGELNRLLTDVCDFTVNVSIDDRNDVAFSLVRDGVVKNLASGSGYEQTAAALALRVVLSNISTMPRPSVLLLDEVLGGVANENYERMKTLFKRVAKDYSCVLHITHLEQIVDWHDSILTVIKENNISRIKQE